MDNASSHSQIARSAGVIGLATLCSRILGFVRDMVIARLFGVYVYAQAFVIAFRIPNLFRDLLGEGASNAAFVPVFATYRLQHSKEEFWELANAVLNLLLVVLMALVLLGVLLSPVIVRLIAPGFSADPSKLEATIRLNRLVFPYVLLVSLAAYAMGLLNSLKHFSVPAFAPCLLNISLIVFTLLFHEGTFGLAAGVLVGGLLQLAVQVPVLWHKGFRPRLFRRLAHPEVKTIGKLMVPRVLSASIYQLNNFVDSVFGSFAAVVGEGGVAVLYFSYRLIQFPLGIFSNSLSQALLPTLSQQAVSADSAHLKRTLSFGLRAVSFVMLPASAGFMVLAGPMVGTLFGGGKFDAYAVDLTSRALAFYAVGLCAYGANKILQSCFFALKDTLTPAKVSLVTLILNIALNAILMFPLRISGLALATSISGIITTLALFTLLCRRLKEFDVRGIGLAFLRMLLATLAMAAVCQVVLRYTNLFLPRQAFYGILYLAALIVVGVISYLAFCVVFGVTEMRQIWQQLVRKT